MIRGYKTPDGKKIVIEIDSDDVQSMSAISNFLIEQISGKSLKEIPGIVNEEEKTPDLKADKTLVEIKPEIKSDEKPKTFDEEVPIFMKNIKINSLLEFYETLAAGDNPTALKEYAKAHKIDVFNGVDKDTLIKIAKCCLKFNPQIQPIDFNKSSLMQIRKFIRSFDVAHNI